MFGRHNIIGSSISFSCNHSNFWNSSFGIGIKKFGTVSDDTIMFLSSTLESFLILMSEDGLNITWKETRNIDKSNDWNVESVTKSNKSTSFDRSIYVKTSGSDFWLFWFKIVTFDRYFGQNRKKLIDKPT